MKTLFVAPLMLTLAACGPNVYVHTSTSGQDRTHLETPVSTPYDENKGHGNDPDRFDEENPGKGHRK